MCDFRSSIEQVTKLYCGTKPFATLNIPLALLRNTLCSNESNFNADFAASKSDIHYPILLYLHVFEV